VGAGRGHRQRRNLGQVLDEDRALVLRAFGHVFAEMWAASLRASREAEMFGNEQDPLEVFQ